MDAFDEIEAQIERQENRLKARELKQRLAEIEKALDGPVQDEGQRPPEKADVEVVPTAKSSLSKKWVNVGKFVLIAVSVVVATYIAAWVVRVLLIVGIAWAAYKLFLEDK